MKENEKRIQLTDGWTLCVSISYDLGGANYMQGTMEKRGYWLHVSPMKIEKTEYGESRQFTIGSGPKGMKAFLLEVKSQSAKRMAAAVEIAKLHERRVILRVLEQNGQTLANPSDLPPEPTEVLPPLPSGKVATAVAPIARGMKMLTGEILARLPALGATSEETDPMIQVKFFDPCGSWSWYGIEFDQSERIFYGYVKGIENEFGNFSLAELEQVRGPLGIGIERDLHFTPCRVSEVQSGARR